MAAKKNRKPSQNAPNVAAEENGFEENVTETERGKGKTIVFHAILSAAALVVVLGGIKCSATILSPILLSLFITIILLVPLRWLQKKGCPAFASFLIVGFAILTLFASIAWMLGSSLDDFINKSDVYAEKITTNIERVETQLHKLGYTFWDAEEAIVPEEATLEESSETPKSETENSSSQETAESYVKIDAKAVLAWILWGMKELRHLAENAIIVLIILMFMIFEAARFPAKLQKAFGGGPITNEHFQKIVEEVRRYVFYKGISNTLSVSLVTIFYYCIGVKYALLWGLIAFFLYFIPNIGAIIAAIPPLLLIFIDQELGGVVTLLIGLAIIETSIGYIVEPKLLGHGLGISTVVVFLSLIFWGWLLGPVGLFLAAPLTIIVKIVLQTFDETRWIAILLAEKVPND